MPVREWFDDGTWPGSIRHPVRAIRSFIHRSLQPAAREVNQFSQTVIVQVYTQDKANKGPVGGHRRGLLSLIYGSSARTRTWNQPVNSRPLCLLSYRGTNQPDYTQRAPQRQIRALRNVSIPQEVTQSTVPQGRAQLA